MAYTEILKAMQNEYAALTGCSADSAGDIGIRIKILAGELAKLYDRCSQLQKNAFPDSATGQWLDKHAKVKNLERKPKIKSRGKLLFSRDLPASSNITIPKGTICQTDSVDGITFVTTEDGVILSGTTDAVVSAESFEGGADKNVAAGAVNLFVTMIQGISTVSNITPFDGGADVEDDLSLRERLLSSYKNNSNGTNSAYYYRVAMEHPEVYSAQIIPRSGGRGKVAVVVAAKGGSLPQAAINDLQKLLKEKREIGVDVQVSSAVVKNVDVDISVLPAVGYENDGTVLDRVEDAIRQTVLGQKVGESLQIKDLYKNLLEIDGVGNFKILSPSDDVAVALNELVVLNGANVKVMGNS